jgi:trehalose 6-phosphate phosphatase
MEAQYALSRAGERALEALSGRRLLAAFDFDGTIAPIALRPEQVVTPPGARAALERLRGLCPIAIISGRARDDVLARIGVEVDFVVGNHGIEGLPGAEREMAECRAVAREWLLQLRRCPDPALHEPGVFVEDKALSLAVHFRQARDAARAKRALPALLQALRPAPRIVTGKCVFNLLPPSSVDKGTALLRLMEVTQAEAALYVGDDDTDEDVFALHEAALLSVRVGRSDASHARFYLRAPQEIPRLVDLLIRGLRPAQAAPARGGRGTNGRRAGPTA